MPILTLRPASAGDETNYPAQVPDSGEHWDKVDDVVPDEASTIIQIAGSVGNPYYRDLFNLQAFDAPSGTIHGIVVCCRWNRLYYDTYGRISIKTGGTVYESSLITISSIQPFYPFGTYSQAWATNPDTSVAWTWADLATLQAGTEQNSWYLAYNNYGRARCTQVFVQVYYGDTTVFPNTDNDGTCYNTWGDWDICRAGNDPQLVDEGEPISSMAYQTATYFIYRGFLYFDLTYVDAELVPNTIELRIFAKTKGSASITIVVVEGLQAIPLTPGSYGSNAATQTVLGSIDTDGISLESYNRIKFNSTGRALVVNKCGSILKLCLKDKRDNDDNPMSYSTERYFTFYPNESPNKKPLLIFRTVGRSQAHII